MITSSSKQSDRLIPNRDWQKKLFIIIVSALLMFSSTACSTTSTYTYFKVDILAQFEESSEERIMRSQNVQVVKSELIDEAFKSFVADSAKQSIEDERFESRSMVKRNVDRMTLRLASSNECRHLVVDSNNLSICSVKVYNLLYEATDQIGE